MNFRPKNINGLTRVNPMKFVRSERGIIQIYQAVRKDSGNYIFEEDWHITIFPRGEAPEEKWKSLPVPPKIYNFHYPFELKAWYICFISLL